MLITVKISVFEPSLYWKMSEDTHVWGCSLGLSVAAGINCESAPRCLIPFWEALGRILVFSEANGFKEAHGFGSFSSIHGHLCQLCHFPTGSSLKDH